MINKCPKCGFGQPQDQYCAKCGVDVFAYKAPPQSLSKRLSENLFLQFTLVILLGAGGVYWLRQNSLQNTKSRVEFLKGTQLQLESSSAQNQFQHDVQDQSSMESPAEAQAQADSMNPEGSVPEANAPRPEVRIYFLQVSSQTLNKWLESETLTRIESSDGIMIGYLGEISKILNSPEGQLKVLKSESFPVVLEQIYSSKVLVPRADAGSSRSLASDEATGELAAFATIDSFKEDSVTGQLEVSSDPQTSFPVQFEMSPGSSVLISGFARAKNTEKSAEPELIVVLTLKK